jgi:hypothetical protein
MHDSIFEGAIFGLRGLLQALAAQIIEPAVITAPDPFFFDPAEFQRCSAMRTMETEKAQPSSAISKKNKIFG